MNAAYTYIIIFIFLCLIGYIYYGYRSNEIRNKQILNELDRKSAHNSYAVFLLADLSQKCSLTDSKIGGIPYWDFSKQAYPVNDNGEDLLLKRIQELPTVNTVDTIYCFCSLTAFTRKM